MVKTPHSRDSVNDQERNIAELAAPNKPIETKTEASKSPATSEVDTMEMVVKTPRPGEASSTGRRRSPNPSLRSSLFSSRINLDSSLLSSRSNLCRGSPLSSSPPRNNSP